MVRIFRSIFLFYSYLSWIGNLTSSEVDDIRGMKTSIGEQSNNTIGAQRECDESLVTDHSDQEVTVRSDEVKDIFCQCMGKSPSTSFYFWSCIYLFYSNCLHIDKLSAFCRLWLKRSIVC